MVRRFEKCEALRVQVPYIKVAPQDLLLSQLLISFYLLLVVYFQETERLLGCTILHDVDLAFIATVDLRFKIVLNLLCGEQSGNGVAIGIGEKFVNDCRHFIFEKLKLQLAL